MQKRGSRASDVCIFHLVTRQAAEMQRFCQRLAHTENCGTLEDSMVLGGKIWGIASSSDIYWYYAL